MKGYHDHYLLTDVLLLSDVFENFRQSIYSNHQLDCVHFYTLPGTRLVYGSEIYGGRVAVFDKSGRIPDDREFHARWNFNSIMLLRSRQQSIDEEGLRPFVISMSLIFTGGPCLNIFLCEISAFDRTGNR